jgi:hypothetical protein
MGCIESVSKSFRSINMLDFNTVQCQFIGRPDDETWDEFPVDKVHWAYNKIKEPLETYKVGPNLTATDPDEILEIFQITYLNTKECLKNIEKKYPTS